MQTRLFLLLSLASLSALALSSAQEKPDGVRTWRSKGKSIDALILGVEDGHVILQPYKPARVPIESLSTEDREFIKKWQQQHQREEQLITKAKLDEIFAGEGVKPLRRNLTILENGEFKPYELPKPENLRLIAYYFTDLKAPNDRFLPPINDVYKRLRKRTDVFEIVYVSLDASEKASESTVKKEGVPFPIFDFVLARRTPFFGRLSKQVVPQLVVVNTKGEVLADSYVNQDDRGNFGEAVKALEKQIRIARREVEGTDEDEGENAE